MRQRAIAFDPIITKEDMVVILGKGPGGDNDLWYRGRDVLEYFSYHEDGENEYDNEDDEDDNEDDGDEALRSDTWFPPSKNISDLLHARGASAIHKLPHARRHSVLDTSQEIFKEAFNSVFLERYRQYYEDIFVTVRRALPGGKTKGNIDCICTYKY